MPFPPLTQAEIDQYYRTAEPDPPANTYEVALVLGGTVSAGAYTAGFLDFLIEALDQWTAAKAAAAAGKGPAVPTHNVVLKVIAGTSGGGINALLAARALAYDFPPITQANTAQGPSNPFYNLWVKSITMLGLLGTSDLDGGGSIQSLLNDNVRWAAAGGVVNFSGAAKPRSYAGYPAKGVPLHVIQTLTNLAGVPYFVPFLRGNERFTDHADYVRYGVAYTTTDLQNLQIRPDEYLLPVDVAVPAGMRAAVWDQAKLTSLGTSAFPLGFAAPVITRQAEDYRWRVAVLPRFPVNAADPYEILGLTPDWAFLQQTQEQYPPTAGMPAWPQFTFQSVDGGVSDNEPIKLALDILSGFNNPEDGSAVGAKRGMILVDPLLDTNPQPQALATDVVGMAMQTVFQGMLEQTRYSTADLLMAARADVFNRFLVVPQSPGMPQSPATPNGIMSIASGGFGAFMGFASEAFLQYDYLLGRANCRAFLQKDFVLDPNNPVVQGQWAAEPGMAPEASFGAYTDATGSYVPIIPLVGTAANAQPVNAWPYNAFDPTTLTDPIKARCAKLVAIASKGLAQGTALGGILNVFPTVLAQWVLDGTIADKWVAAMSADLVKWQLAPQPATPPPPPTPPPPHSPHGG